LQQRQDTARAQGTSLWQAACAGTIKGKSGTSLAAFVRLIEAAREAKHSLSLSETVAHVIEASGLLAHYRQEKDGSERVENLEELVNAAQSFVREADVAVDAPIRMAATREAVMSLAAPEATIGAADVAGDGQDVEGATDPLTAFLAHAA